MGIEMAISYSTAELILISYTNVNLLYENNIDYV